MCYTAKLCHGLDFAKRSCNGKNLVAKQKLMCQNNVSKRFEAQRFSSVVTEYSSSIAKISQKCVSSKKFLIFCEKILQKVLTFLKNVV